MTENYILILGLSISIIFNIILILALLDESRIKNLWRELYERHVNYDYRELYERQGSDYRELYRNT